MGDYRKDYVRNDRMYCLVYKDEILEVRNLSHSDRQVLADAIIAVHPTKESAELGKQRVAMMFATTQPQRDRVLAFVRSQINQIMEAAEEQQAILLKGCLEVGKPRPTEA